MQCKALLLSITFISSIQLFAQQGVTVRTTESYRLSTEKYGQLIDSGSIWKHLRALAHDSMMGRRPGKQGEAATIKYLAKAFQETGLTPAYKDGYLQPVRLLHANATGTAIFRKDGKIIPIADSFILCKTIQGGDIGLSDAALVFAGYGIVAPEFGWDDYKNVDVKGKIVVVLDREPLQLIQRGFGEKGAMTFQAFFNVKDEMARQHGAAGLILLTESRSISPQLRWWQQNDFTLLADGLAAFQTAVLTRLAKPAAVELAAANNASLEDWKKQANDSNFIPVPLAVRADIHVHTTVAPFTSYNVVGYIKGSDPVLSQECVVYSTHWDGFGIGIPQAGDSIYNAAKDNAGGISEMLNIAKAMHAMPDPPRRSVVFIASTAEESGKLGAEAYVRSPLFPLNKTVLVIGMDIFNPWGQMTRILNASFGYTTVDALLQTLAQKRGIPYQGPVGQSNLAASDQYMFARRGVPAIFAGVDARSSTFSDHQIDSLEAMSAAHSPFDEIFSGWDLTSAADEARIMFEVGVMVADKDTPPRWVGNSSFSRLR